MKIIGLTGGSGSGKGVISEIFATLDIPTIDTDAVYHEMTETDSPCLKALVDEFGEGILSESGTLNRTALAELVFSGKEAVAKRVRLNEITHKFILDETRSRLSKYKAIGYRFAVVDAPVLFESGFDKECDFIICVTADRELRIERITLRDRISKEKAEMRINSQIPEDVIASRCDYVINNNGDLESLRIAVHNAVREIELNKNER